MKKSIIAFALLALCASADARNRHTVYEFRAKNPCPATHLPHGACPGYVVDHVIPLCAGGPDRPSNMQWQAYAPSKVKDRREVQYCSCLRRKGQCGTFQP